ncbi:unnamed protein product [Umbelopsis sp. WA50703]
MEEAMNKRKLQGEEHTDEPETGSSKKLKESATMAESTSVDNQNSKPSASAKSESKQHHKPTWDRLDEELDVDESFLDEGETEEVQEEKGDKNGVAEKKDKLIEAVFDDQLGIVLTRQVPETSTPLDFLKNLSADDRHREIQKISHCSRWIPVDNICNSFLEDISKTFDTMKQTYFTNEQTLRQKVAIVCEVRNNERLNKQDIIKTIAPLLPTTLKVDLKSPDIVIFVSVFKSVCGMSILPKYYELKRYNIPNICESVIE